MLTPVKRVVPVLLLLLTALPQAALAGQWYRCRYSGETRTTCCCGAAEKPDEVAGAEVRRTSCCDLVRNHPQAVNAQVESRREVRVPLGPLALHPAPAHALVAAAPAHELWPIERATAPPQPVPAYLRHSSLLL